MDIVSRLILSLLLLAALPLRAQVTYSITALTFTGTGTTVSAAAASVAQQYTNAKYPICVQNGQTLATDQARVKSVSGLVVVFERYGPAGTPCVVANRETTATATQSGQVSCPSNQEVGDSGSCECKAIRNAGSFMVTGDHYDGCNQGCSMVLSSGWYDKTANTTWGTWNQTGSSCTAGTPSVLTSNDPKVEAAKQCAAGTCPGTVNGQSVCVPCDKTKQTTTASKSESASETPSGASSPASSGSSSEEESEQTECKDGQCTTNKKTVGVGADGKKTEKNEKTVQPQSKYCEANPKASVCKGTQSSWGGSCGSFSCDGDAVTCAIAQASWKSACAIDIDETDPKVTAGNAAMSGGDRPGDHPGNTPEQNAFTANIDQSNPFGSECPADIPLDVMGQSVSIPLSHACDSLKFMGQVAVAFAMCAAAFIVFGGIKG